MKTDSRYKETWATKQKCQKEAATVLFNELAEEYRFREYDFASLYQAMEQKRFFFINKI